MVVCASATDEKRVRTVGSEEAVDHLAVRCGKIQRQALFTENIADIGDEFFQIGLCRINFINDNNAAELIFPGMLHHRLGSRFNAGFGVDYNCRGFHRPQYTKGPAEEIGQAGVSIRFICRPSFRTRPAMSSGCACNSALRFEIAHCVSAFNGAWFCIAPA